MRFGKDAQGIPLMANAVLPRLRACRNTSGGARVAGEIVVWNTAATFTNAGGTSEATIPGYDVTTTAQRNDQRVAGVLLTPMAADGEGVLLEFGSTPVSEATIRQAGKDSVSLSATKLRVHLEIGESLAVGTRLAASETEGRAAPAPAASAALEPGAQVGFSREAVSAVALATDTTVEAFVCVR